MDCDLWMLTEVSERLAMDGYHLHRGVRLMAQKRRWAGILSRQVMTPMPDPHPASAMAQVNDLTVCSSILPWKGSGGLAPWVGARHVDRTEATINDLDHALPRRALVWGGDWNHALSGREYAGSIGGRRHVLGLLEGRGMRVPTAGLPHRIEGLLSIDHIGLTEDLRSGDATRFRAESPDGRRLSDHDGYVLTLAQG
jgi:hypothetical protein